MNILWVENNRLFARIVLKTFLVTHDVVVTPSLALARQALASRQFDAILLDYDLDDGKGTELLPDIKALPQTPRVIAVSSHATGNSLLEQAGANAICSKRHFSSVEDVLTNT